MNTKIIITGLDPDKRESIRAAIDEMAEKLFRRHAHIAHIRFEVGATTLSSGARTYNVMGLIWLQKSHVVATLETGGNLGKSINAVMDKLERMLIEPRPALEDGWRPASGADISASAMTINTLAGSSRCLEK